MIYSVIVDVSASEVDKIFDYKGDGYTVGSRVSVNFANRITEGYIVEEKQTSLYPENKLKEIIKQLDDFPVISSEMLELSRFMREAYHLRWIDVLRLFIPAEMRGNRVRTLSRKQVRLVDGNIPVESLLAGIKQNAVKQKQLITYLHDHGATLVCKLGDLASAVSPLVNKGICEVTDITVTRTPYSNLDATGNAKHTLVPMQQNAVDTVFANPSGSYLLHGVTGSGKTEVYLTVMDKLVAQGKNCIMLVPEISLTPSMLRQLRQRFGSNVALLHSGLSVGERYDEWLRLKTGQAQIAIGARSAIFAPLDNIGAIIIDEEHDSSYVSDNNPRYNTIDVAKFRAKYNNCMLILGSATPSLNSFYSAKQGKLQLISMPERINKMPLPQVDIVDMASETRKGNKGIFSPLLIQRLKETVEKGNQAMLFLNRRGYSSFLMCTKCGYVARCTDCDVTLTVHKQDGELKCHYCGKRFKMLTRCPECHSDSFRNGKIGTQQVVDILHELMPEVKVLRMDADTTASKEGHGKILSAFAKGEAQILVGTQMIAKGHDFPHVTLVGILDGDQSLYYSDYLSAERTFQLITQVAGRSGRNVDEGRVVLQTYTPTHYCLQLASKQDYISFYKREINLREASRFPPFCEIVRILYQGENEKDCIDLVTKHFADIDNIKVDHTDAFYYLDKMRCPVKRAEKKFRFQILMKLDNDYVTDILPLVYSVCDGTKTNGVQVFVERNPQNMN